MNMIKLALLAVGVSAATLPAQDPNIRGIAGGLSYGLVYSNAGPTPGLPAFRTSGASPTLQTFSGGLVSAPDYDLSTLDPQIRDLMDIDGFSTGNDRLSVDPSNGEIMVGSGVWATVEVSARQDATFPPMSYLGGLSTTTGQGPGGEIVSSYHGDDIPDVLYNDTVIELSSTDIASLPDIQVELSAMDQFAALVYSYPTVVDPLHQCLDRIFISLTSASATKLKNQTSFWEIDGNGDSIPQIDRNGATILRFEWTQHATNGSWSWIGPFVHATADDLGLTEYDDVDALGVHGEPGRNTGTGDIFFSTRISNDFRPQLQVWTEVNDTVHTLKHKKNAGGGPSLPFEGNIRFINTTDLDAFCAIDPDMVYSRSCGTAEDFPSLSLVMGTSVTRNVLDITRPLPAVIPGGTTTVPPIDEIVVTSFGWGGYTPPPYWPVPIGTVTFHLQDAISGTPLSSFTVDRNFDDDVVELRYQVPAGFRPPPGPNVPPVVSIRIWPIFQPTYPAQSPHYFGVPSVIGF